MNILLKSVKIYDQASPYHLKLKDILIERGVIVDILDSIKSNSKTVFKKENTCVSPSWIDMHFYCYEPGFEYREDFKSGLTAAANAGFGRVCMMPNTVPPIDNKSQVEFVQNATASFLTDIVPIGAISSKLEGKDLAELYDMNKGGANVFSDGSKGIENAGLMERALQYVKKTNGLVFNLPIQENLIVDSQMNEGEVSTKLGLVGQANIAEDIMVSRDLYLLEYTHSKLHFTAISTKGAVDLIKEAKKKGLKVSAAVNVANLAFSDAALEEYDTHYKVQPVLRSNSDIKALKNGLKKGLIDTICSGHNPMHQDEKLVEFENAAFGMSTIDVAFAVAYTACKNILSEEEFVEKWLAGYNILNIPRPIIQKGEKADMSIFSFMNSSIINKNDIYSKGKNNPFIGKKLCGKSYGVLRKNKTNIL